MVLTFQVSRKFLTSWKMQKNEEVKLLFYQQKGKSFQLVGDLSEMNAQSMRMTSSLCLIAELVNTISKRKSSNFKTGCYDGRWSGCWSQLPNIAVAVDFGVISDRTLNLSKPLLGWLFSTGCGWVILIRKSHWHVSGYSFSNDG